MADLNKYWALFEKKGRGAPLSLAEGIMHTEFQKKNPFAPLPSDSGDWRNGDWRNSVNAPVELPKQLWFVTRDRVYNFDLRFYSEGFIVSHVFLGLLQRHTSTPYVSTPVYMVNKFGDSVAKKEYYYIRFYNYTDLIDHTSSNIVYDKKGFIKKPIELHLRTDISQQVFMTDSSYFFNRLFCTDEFRKACLEASIYGVEFVEASKAGTYKP